MRNRARTISEAGRNTGGALRRFGRSGVLMGGQREKFVLDDASEEECRAISGLPEKDIWMTGLFFLFLNLSRGCRKSRFAPVDMKKLLEIYFEKTLVSRGEQEK